VYPSVSVLRRRSERKIIVVCNASIAATFLVCLGQQVDMLIELQFWALKVKCDIIFWLLQSPCWGVA
jgi:hypothetical protein